MSFSTELRDILLTIPDAKLVSGGKEIAMRCRFCGDSINPSSKHFYISLGSESAPPMYNCKKCNESGVLTAKILREIIGIYDIKILDALLNEMKRITSRPGGQIYNKEVIRYRLYNGYTRNDKLTELKLKYINDRIGTNISIQEALNNKIVFNLYDLLRSNHIEDITRHKNITDQLDQSFIGFISLDNNFINMRNLRPGKVYQSIDKRYVNYNIFNKNSNLERYYILPNNIYAGSIDPIKINIAEGPFDILSVFYNVKHQERYNNIYAAIGGKSYLNIIRFFIVMLGLINIELHLYIDNDYSMREIRQLYDNIWYYNIPIYIHRNVYEGEKDFGVHPNNIKESISDIRSII